MNIAIPDRYQLAANFEQRAAAFSFPAEVWNVAAELIEIKEWTTSLELERLTGHSSEQVREALGRLLAEKLVRQNVMTWKEYSVAREGIGSAAMSAVAAAPPVSAVAQPLIAAKIAPLAVTSSVKATVVASASAAKSAQEGVGLRLGTIAPKQVVASSSNAWVLQKPDLAKVSASHSVDSISPPGGGQANGRLLRPLLEQIANIKGGGVEGQLLVYQVFLRVPYQLLHDEGIKALHFVDERTVIQTSSLHAAIVKAAKDVAGIDLV